MIDVPDSTTAQPPFLGPMPPTYPQVAQIVRVYAEALMGTNVYPCYVQQWASPLVLRDREPAFVWEPNGILLGPGYYDARLVNVYSGLPLFVATCCTSDGFSSSSSSSSGISSSSSSGG